MMKIEEMIAANRADCCGCAACANICPRNAITMTRDAEGFAYPKINLELCIKCGRCDATCPALNFKPKNIAAFPATFAAIHNDGKILRHSSSGGVFSALAEIVFGGGGIVFGAAFDKNWRVFHTAARTLDELENLRGSKYVQSQIGEVYRQVKGALKSTVVLFSGTPCQCVGLKNFLGSDPENLLTVDIICHGAPSPAVWENYIGEIGNRNEIAHVNFRSKRNGWHNFCIEINFNDRGYYALPIGQELFGKLFLQNLTLRPSCQSCKAKFPNGKSDLTLGDAWGIQNFAPEMFDNRGVSVVFVHTPKGRNFFERTNLRRQKVNFAGAVRSNIAFMASVAADERRDKFFADFANYADKFAVMEKYYYQNDAAISKRVSAQNEVAFRENYLELAAQVRGTFKRNILIAASNLGNEAKNFLLRHFEENLPEINFYVLQRTDAGKLVCTENFSQLNFDLNENADELKDFAAQFNITEILIDDQSESPSPAFNEWLKNCGLSVRTFSLIKNS